MFRITDIAVLRDQLPSIDFHTPVTLTPEVMRYLNYYGLNSASIFRHPEVDSLHCFGCFHSAGFRIACHYFSPPPAQCRGTVFILHGYYDHCGLYTHLIKYFVQKNFAVVVFDLPGHGLSTGAQVSIESFGQYREVFSECLRLAHKANVKLPLYLIGQSTGGAIAMDYCLSHCDESRYRFERIMLLAPLFRPYQWTRGSLLHTVISPFLSSVQRNFAANSSDQEFLRFVRESDPLQSRRLSAAWVGALKEWMCEFVARRPCAVRVAIVQGTLDTTVDWRYNLKLIERKFPEASIYMIANARHHLANESADLRARLLAILDSIVGSVPGSE